eukprot:CAMPEP_0198598090 /NCGR_PEP_ID=MMETSP1462-20131121/145232_1 /TAXON_ID=1333877 /ORGANISM="Brandtodinium nutriculum, Strain RCC3387" /LENGTH=43 /DNA_ID= /DNA_START= /DNA_END= /DNA_ORIENTATION=
MRAMHKGDAEQHGRSVALLRVAASGSLGARARGTKDAEPALAG